jgi:hypothetical protein
MLNRYSVKVIVHAGETLRVFDTIQQMSYFDLNVVVVPFDNFTGTMQLFLGAFGADIITFTDEKKIGVGTLEPPDYPELLPATVQTSYEHECGEAGDELVVAVELVNNGLVDIVFKIHFMRKIR